MPECYVDTNLIEYLLSAGVNHQHCCSKVVGQLKTKFLDRFAIGIIDRDKVELGYIGECVSLARTDHLTLMKHKVKEQYLITVAPAMDRFILDCAKEQNIDTTRFDIPSDLKGFTRISKSVNSNNDPRFRSLFAAINNHPEIRILKHALEHLCEKKYKADTGVLISVFSGK